MEVDRDAHRPDDERQVLISRHVHDATKMERWVKQQSVYAIENFPSLQHTKSKSDGLQSAYELHRDQGVSQLTSAWGQLGTYLVLEEGFNE